MFRESSRFFGDRNKTQGKLVKRYNSAAGQNHDGVAKNIRVTEEEKRAAEVFFESLRKKQSQ